MDCFVCEKHRRGDAAQGGVLFEDELVYVGHTHALDGPTAYRGYLMVEPKRHAPGLGDLTDQEAEAIGRVTNKVARAQRDAAIYAALMLVFRIAGKRTLSQITTFDFVLLLVVGEATQQAMLGDDFSVTNGILVVATIVAIDIALSFVKEHVAWFNKVRDGPAENGLAAASVTSGRGLDVACDDPTMLPDHTFASKAELLVGREGAVVEKPCWNRVNGLGIPLDGTAAVVPNQLKSTFERDA